MGTTTTEIETLPMQVIEAAKQKTGISTPRDGSPSVGARHRHIHHDTESIQSHNFDSDPYSLSRALKSPSEISLIKRSVSQSNSNNATKKQRYEKKASPKELREFYEAQNTKIQKLLKSVEEHRSSAKDAQGDTAVKYKIAVVGSFVANILLAGLQLFAAIKSGSLSLFTSS